jgi:hypothetical protein
MRTSDSQPTYPIHPRLHNQLMRVNANRLSNKKQEHDEFALPMTKLESQSSLRLPDFDADAFDSRLVWPQIIAPAKIPVLLTLVSYSIYEKAPLLINVSLKGIGDKILLYLSWQSQI